MMVVLWNYLVDKIDGDYQWCKESRDFANCYVCYHGKIEVGFIPINGQQKNLEWQNWWHDAYQRHPSGITLDALMDEIVERHQRRLSRMKTGEQQWK